MGSSLETSPGCTGTPGAEWPGHQPRQMQFCPALTISVTRLQPQELFHSAIMLIHFSRCLRLKMSVSLQRFLGMVNFYRKFLPGIAKILRPLTDALAGNPRSLNWSEAQQESFEKAKSALSSAVPLAHPSPSTEVSLVTDTSTTHVGAVLQQREKSSWRPLAFFSTKLSATQQRYSTFDRELLGVFLALRHFRFELEGRRFHIITDHLTLVSALFRVSPPWSAANNASYHIYQSLPVIFAMLQVPQCCCR